MLMRKSKLKGVAPSLFEEPAYSVVSRPGVGHWEASMWPRRPENHPGAYTETDQPTSSSKQGKMKKVPGQPKSENGGKVR